MPAWNWKKALSCICLAYVYVSLIAYIRASSVVKCAPAKCFFRSGNRWKSEGARSEEHGGCFPNQWIVVMAIADMRVWRGVAGGGGGLSPLKTTPLVNFPWHLAMILSHNCHSKVA